MNLELLLILLLQGIVVVAIAPVAIGVIRQTRAKMEGRVGAGILQPLRDIRKLLKKERIKPNYASFIFQMAPLVLFGTSLVAALAVPLISTHNIFANSADFIVVVLLLLIGTVFLALAGLDAGTAFGGMGASREMTIAALGESSMMLVILALSSRAESTQVSYIVQAGLTDPSKLIAPASLFALGALLIVTLAENGRIPVDNPSTHLELTMVHEAMILEYSGRDLALVELGSHLRLIIFLGFISSLFFPWGIATTITPVTIAIGTAALVIKILVLAVVLGAAEVFMAKLRLFRIPELLAAAFVLSFLALTVSFYFA